MKSIIKKTLAAALALAVAAGGTAAQYGGGVLPGMGLTAYAAPTETLLTTITGAGSNASPATSANVSYSTEGVATLTFSQPTPNGQVSYQASPAWGWWGYDITLTVTPAEGYTITKCVFYDNENRTATDSDVPFVVETTEEDKTPKVNGTIMNYYSKGIKKIDVYGYVTPDTVAVKGINLGKSETTLTVGASETLTATVAPNDATDKTVTWSSNNTDVATVDENGTVTAVAEGTATITATSNMVNTVSASCTVTVTNPLPTAAFETKEATANNAVGFAATVKELNNASEITGAGFVFANVDGAYDDPSKVNSDADFKTEECPVNNAPKVGEAFTYEFKNLTKYSKCGLKAIPYIITDKGVAWGEFFGSIIDIIR